MRLRATTCVLAPLLLISGLALSACGSTGQASTTRSGGARPAHPHSRPRSATPAARKGPRIGATQSVRAQGTTLVVRITSVINPLRGSGAAVLPGMKVVGVMASVRDAGPSGYDGSYTSNFSLRSAAGLASPVFVPSGPCQTQVQDFMNEIGAGELRTGCVAFSIPKAQAPISVRFSADEGSGGPILSWLVSR